MFINNIYPYSDPEDDIVESLPQLPGSCDEKGQVLYCTTEVEVGRGVVLWFIPRRLSGKRCFSALSGCWNYLDNVVSQSERILMLSGERFPALSWFLNYLENIVSQPWADSETIWKTFFTSLSRFWNYLENVISHSERISKLSGERCFPALSWFLNYLEKFVSQPWADSETIWRNLFPSPERILKLSGEVCFPALSGFLNYLENVVS